MKLLLASLWSATRNKGGNLGTNVLYVIVGKWIIQRRPVDFLTVSVAMFTQTNTDFDENRHMLVQVLKFSMLTRGSFEAVSRGHSRIYKMLALWLHLICDECVAVWF